MLRRLRRIWHALGPDQTGADMREAIDSDRDRRTLTVLLEMARLDALEARDLKGLLRARKEADELLDDYLRIFGRPAER